MIRSIIAAIFIALLVTFGGPPMMLYTFLTCSGDALYHGGLGGTLLIARAIPALGWPGFAAVIPSSSAVSNMS